ncbi:helix-turn-helix transcriptional regulator [Massilia sp. X63]|jgi:transcriptional regulator with XRE-family HTH domain|uniref:helix-turn-helix transcriptional regulator n=1 Tax=Massilia sp. X63 TaxID=3237285 RepID=UPI0034DD218B
MSKRKTVNKEQTRERRNQLLQTAAAAQLSLTEGVREMRAISGLTQEEFARHREVSARVIKALELGQGNPTVATLNRIGEFFGLEVAFVPSKQIRSSATEAAHELETERPSGAPTHADIVARIADLKSIERYRHLADLTGVSRLKELAENQERLLANIRQLNQMFHGLDKQLDEFEHVRKDLEPARESVPTLEPRRKPVPKKMAAVTASAGKKRKTGSS